MKEVIALLIFTFTLTGVALAENDPVNNRTDPTKPAKESTYKVSLSKSYFSIFNLFSIEPASKDTLAREKARVVEDELRAK
jgi:hypothetical protein